MYKVYGRCTNFTAEVFDPQRLIKQNKTFNFVNLIVNYHGHDSNILTENRKSIVANGNSKLLSINFLSNYGIQHLQFHSAASS